MLLDRADLLNKLVWISCLICIVSFWRSPEIAWGATGTWKTCGTFLRSVWRASCWSGQCVEVCRPARVRSRVSAMFGDLKKSLVHHGWAPLEPVGDVLADRNTEVDSSVISSMRCVLCRHCWSCRVRVIWLLGNGSPLSRWYRFGWLSLM